MIFVIKFNIFIYSSRDTVVSRASRVARDGPCIFTRETKSWDEPRLSDLNNGWADWVDNNRQRIQIIWYNSQIIKDQNRRTQKLHQEKYRSEFCHHRASLKICPWFWLGQCRDFGRGNAF